MKLTRKLIPAFIMLLVSAVLMSTASFAWFAMNTTVTATGMEVTANADNIFLEISIKDADSWSTEADANFTNVVLYPVAHEEFESKDDITTITAEGGKWYHSYSTVLNDAAVTDGAPDNAKTYLKSGTHDLSDYVATASYQVRLNNKMVQTAGNLTVTNVTLPAEGITLIVQCGSNICEFTEGGAITSDNVLADTTSTTALEVNAYIYIDGNNENVITNNVTSLTGTVAFTLTVAES